MRAILVSKGDTIVPLFPLVMFAAHVVCTQEQDAKQRDRSNSKTSGKSEGQVRTNL